MRRVLERTKLRKVIKDAQESAASSKVNLTARKLPSEENKLETDHEDSLFNTFVKKARPLLLPPIDR